MLTHRTVSTSSVASLLALVSGCSSSSSRADAGAAAILASGAAYQFGGAGGAIAHAQLTILELPTQQATTAADGTFQFTGLPANTSLTFALQGANVTSTLTGTFDSATNLSNVIFQVPSTNIYNALAALLGFTPQPDRCQIASTITRQGEMGNDTGGNGEPDATAIISPALPSDGQGPIYFSPGPGQVLPDRTLTATSSDGGILYLNVPPGQYTLTAQKAGTTFSSVHINCVAGKLVNAAPPWGVAALTGGIGPKTDAGQ